MGSTLAVQDATMEPQMAFQFREFHASAFENLAHRMWGKALFRKLALALQSKF